MSLPIIKQETIIAVFSKALSSDPATYTGERLNNLIANGQKDLASAVVTHCEVLGSAITDRFPVEEDMKSEVERLITIAFATIGCITYDMLNAQVEADELTEMYSDDITGTD